MRGNSRRRLRSGARFGIIPSMKKHLLAAILAVCAASGAQAFSLFGSGGSQTNKPPKLSALMAKANDLLDQAEVLAAGMKRDEALAKYREALAEMDAVSAKYPAQTNSAVFRNRRLQCMTRIDAFKLEDSSMTSYPVNVTDTSELQRRYEEKHGIKPKAAPAKKETEAPAAAKTAPAGQSAAAPARPPAAAKPAPAASAKAAPAGAPGCEQLLAEARIMIRGGNAAGAKEKILEAMKTHSSDKEAIYLYAYVSRLQGDAETARKFLSYTAGKLVRQGVSRARPGKEDAKALVLYASLEADAGETPTARTALDLAIRADPSSHIPYYNMAILLSADSAGIGPAKAYYELGRKKGGPRDAAIEARLGTGGEGK